MCLKYPLAMLLLSKIYLWISLRSCLTSSFHVIDSIHSHFSGYKGLCIQDLGYQTKYVKCCSKNSDKNIVLDSEKLKEVHCLW